MVSAGLGSDNMDHDELLSPSICPALGRRIWWDQGGQMPDNPGTFFLAAQLSHVPQQGGTERWTAAWGEHCHTGGCCLSPVTMTVLEWNCSLFVCNQPPSQPATRHPKPCARLPGAKQAGAPSAICALTPGLCQNTCRSPDSHWERHWGMSPPTAATQRAGRRELGRVPQPRDVPEVPKQPWSSRSLQGSWGVSLTWLLAHRALEGIDLAGVGLDLVPVLQHLLFCLPQRVIVLVSCLRQVRHLGRDRGQQTWSLGPNAPGPAWGTPPTAPWTCTTPQPRRCSWRRCSRTEHGCPAAQPSGQAWRCPSPPGCAAPAAEPATPGFPGGTR